MRTTAIFIIISISMTSTRCHQHAPSYPQYDQTETNHDRLEQTQWSKRDSRSTRISERDGQMQIGILPELAASPDVVVFPGRSRRAAQFVPNVPEECKRMGICEDVPDYPKEHVAAIIEQLGNATDKFNLDELNTPELASRSGQDDTELCDFSVKIAAPMAARDKNGNWLYIINRKDKPFQGYHVEICKDPGNLCSNVAYFYTGYEARCQQKFMLRFMKALDANGKLVEKQFKMPSCCTCLVRQKNE